MNCLATNRQKQSEDKLKQSPVPDSKLDSVNHTHSPVRCQTQADFLKHF